LSFCRIAHLAAQTTCGGRILACCSGCASVLCDAVGWVRTLIGCVLLLVSLVLVGSLVRARAREAKRLYSVALTSFP
jgi:hypothetical protein